MGPKLLVGAGAPCRVRCIKPGLVKGFSSSSPLHHHRHGLVIVPLHLEIGHPAVPLRGFDPGMPQEILDGHQGSVGIEELGSKGMPMRFWAMTLTQA